MSLKNRTCASDSDTYFGNYPLRSFEILRSFLLTLPQNRRGQIKCADPQYYIDTSMVGAINQSHYVT